jgi:hypothetical protein
LLVSLALVPSRRVVQQNTANPPSNPSNSDADSQLDVCYLRSKPTCECNNEDHRALKNDAARRPSSAKRPQPLQLLPQSLRIAQLRDGDVAKPHVALGQHDRLSAFGETPGIAFQDRLARACVGDS